MKKVCLVTGAAGFIGSHVVDELIKLNYDVIVLDDLSGGFLKNVNKKATFYKGSILNETLLDKIFKKHNPDYVFHLAAYAAEGLSHFIRKYNYKNNLIGTVNLINRSVLYNVSHFVYTSSIAVYGSNRTPMTEDLTPNPEDPYAISKYAAELDLKQAFELFGLKYTVFRPHNVYGPRQNTSDPYRNVVGIFINNLMQKKTIKIFGSGEQTRAFTHINDVAPYIAKTPSTKGTVGEVFNIGADKPYSLNALALLVTKSMGLEPERYIQYEPARHEVLEAYSDHTKFKKVFKPVKTVPLEVGIKEVVLWAKKSGYTKPVLFEKIEITKNLPPIWKKLYLNK